MGVQGNPAFTSTPIYMNTINTTGASISRRLEQIRDNVNALTSRTEQLIRNKQSNQTAGPRRLSDFERQKAIQLLDDGEPVAKVAKIINTTRMTLYTLLHNERPGFRQRVFHDESAA